MRKKLHDPIEGVTPDGMIITGARPGRLSSAFRPILDETVKELSSYGKDISLYVYGSVATGTARVGYSDVDLITVGLDTESAQKLGEKLSGEFTELCRGIEIVSCQRSDFDGSDDESYGYRIFLRHYCVHLAGPDFRNEFPNFPADAAAARGLNGDIGEFFDKWKTEFERNGTANLLGRRIARKTLLAVSGLVSMHDHTWTTDRVTAAKRWAEVLPEIADDLEKLVILSDEFSQELPLAEVQKMLDHLVAKVVNDFARLIGLWNA